MNPIVSNGNKLRWKFENVEDLTDDGMYSEKFTFENIDWKIKVRTITENNVKYLSIHVYYDCENKDGKNWICESVRTIKLLNQVEKGQDISATANACDDATEYRWGFATFAYWSDFLASGYLKNNSIVVEVDLNFKYYDFSKNIPCYTDITINVEGTDFYVNRGALCLKSKYFYDLFVNKMMENYKQLIELAAKYGVPTLHENCEKFLISETDIELTEKLNYADQHGYHELMKTCIDSLKSAQQINLLHKSVEFHNFKATTKLCIMTRLLNFL